LLRDPGLRQSLGDAGRKRVEDEFSAERMVAKIVTVYERFLAARTAAG
jgi:glycosyltransferase involved in cell wall biosynthesis